MFIETRETLVASDGDGGVQDVYERFGNATTLVSTATGGTSATANFAGASQDGSRVFFTTLESLTSADEDGGFRDIYERSNGATTLVSASQTGGNGAFNATFHVASEDGTRVLFSTLEPLTSADGDSSRDVYVRSGGSTTLVSASSSGASAAVHATYAGASADATRVFFETNEQLTGDDTDTENDVYQRFGTTTTRQSTGPAGGNGTLEDFYDASFAGASRDGTRVFIETDEALVSDDGDVFIDVYERTGSSTARISTGPSGGNGDWPADFRGASADGTRAFFQTGEALVGSDDDLGFQDVYERAGTTTTLVSTGPGDPGGYDASFAGASQSGARVFFTTPLALDPGDMDGAWRDIYERSGGGTTLLSIGPAGGAEPRNAFYSGASQDGSRVFFQTDEKLLDADGDPNLQDVYEHVGGVTTLISSGPAGGAGPFFGSFAGASQDGTRAFFHSAETLLSVDVDSAQDVYSAGPAPYPVPKEASSVAVSLVPAFRQTISASQCSARGGANSTHGAPLSFASCSSPAYAPGTTGRLGPAAVGSAEVAVLPGNLATLADEADVAFTASVGDVRSGSSSGPDYDPNPGGADLTLLAKLRISDLHNGTSLSDPGTVADLDFAVPVTCAGTAGPGGAACDVSTTADAVVPGAILEGRRTVIELFRVRLNDAGPNGARGDSDDRLFAIEGLYAP